MLTLLLTLSLGQAAAAKPAADAVKFSPPAAIAELDMGKLKGEPWKLAWSADAKELYIQTAERDGAGVVQKARHYIIPAAGGAPKSVEEEPAWAAKYWAWKSWKAAPGSPSFQIALDERREILRATNPGRGASEAGLGGDPSAGAPVGGGGAAGRAGSVVISEGQNAVIRTMKLKGEVIGEWVNTVIVPGLTFGWSPAALDMIAFSPKDEDVVIMDQQGRKQRIDTGKTTRLPAWSDDGRKLAFLEQKDRKKFVLHVVEVGSP
jgi:hypothetical protein